MDMKTMKTADILYKDYLNLGDEQKSEVDFWLEYGKYETKDYLSDKDIRDRSFKLVKELINAYIKQDSEEIARIINTIPEYNEKNIVKTKTYEVIFTFKYIAEVIMNLIQIENEYLVSHVPGYNYAAEVEQVDFSIFPNYYAQIRELAQGDILKFKQIEQLPYSDCLTELIYLQKQADLEKLCANHQK